MTVTTCAGMGAMPQATMAGGPTPINDLSAQLQPLVVQLQSLTQQLQQLAASLSASAPAAGAATLGGGASGSSGCSMSGCASAGGALQGSATVEQGANGGTRAPAATASKQPAASDAATGAAADLSVPRKNPRSAEEAIAWARKQATSPSQSWDHLCLSFVAHAYGWSGSGVHYAIDHYKTAPKEMRHDGDRNPPPGALMYWDTGQRAGHVALYLGNGMIASNDIRQAGKISIVPVEEISKKWGAKYVGWQPPYFPEAG
jgi:cell wall-associated NlpC family hydrolase